MLGRDFKSPVAKTREQRSGLRIFFTADYPCILTFIPSTQIASALKKKHTADACTSGCQVSWQGVPSSR